MNWFSQNMGFGKDIMTKNPKCWKQGEGVVKSENISFLMFLLLWESPKTKQLPCEKNYLTLCEGWSACIRRYHQNWFLASLSKQQQQIYDAVNFYICDLNPTKVVDSRSKACPRKRKRHRWASPTLSLTTGGCPMKPCERSTRTLKKYLRKSKKYCPSIVQALSKYCPMKLCERSTRTLRKYPRKSKKHYQHKWERRREYQKPKSK